MSERICVGGSSNCNVIDFLAMRAKINMNDMDHALMWAKKEIQYYEIEPQLVRFEDFDDAPDRPNTHVSMFAINNDAAYYRICETFTGSDAITPDMRRTAGTIKRDRITYMQAVNFAELREKYPERVARLLKNGAYLALCETNPARAKSQFI